MIDSQWTSPILFHTGGESTVNEPGVPILILRLGEGSITGFLG